jgi:hypothetical protein
MIGYVVTQVAPEFLCIRAILPQLGKYCIVVIEDAFTTCEALLGCWRQESNLIILGIREMLEAICVE